MTLAELLEKAKATAEIERIASEICMKYAGAPPLFIKTPHGDVKVTSDESVPLNELRVTKTIRCTVAANTPVGTLTLQSGPVVRDEYAEVANSLYAPSRALADKLRPILPTPKELLDHALAAARRLGRGMRWMLEVGAAPPTFPQIIRVHDVHGADHLCGRERRVLIARVSGADVARLDVDAVRRACFGAAEIAADCMLWSTSDPTGDVVRFLRVAPDSLRYVPHDDLGLFVAREAVRDEVVIAIEARWYVSPPGVVLP